MPYLSPTQITAGGDPASSASVDAKQTALVGLVTEILAEHGSYTVSTALTPTVIGGGGSDRALRLATMGDPARFAEVEWDGDDGATYDPHAVGHRFTVSLYYGTGWGLGAPPANQAAVEAVAAAFRAVCEGEGVWDGSAWTTAPGLLWALRRQDAVILASGDVSDLADPGGVEVAYNERPDDRNPDDRHRLSFSILVA